MTVEDESFNMFEILRNFATRSQEQGFVNVIVSEYLLKDYMADNDKIFAADPKAIPYIVADYARTVRNVSFRLILLMSTGGVREEALKKELSLMGLPETGLACGSRCGMGFINAMPARWRPARTRTTMKAMCWKRPTGKLWCRDASGPLT